MIGRRKIDSYVLYYSYMKRIPMIDISSGSSSIGIESPIVLGIHQGRDTYNNHIKNHKSNDYYYNSQFYDDRNQKKASLSNCLYRAGTISKPFIYSLDSEKCLFTKV